MSGYSRGYTGGGGQGFSRDNGNSGRSQSLRDNMNDGSSNRAQQREEMRQYQAQIAEQDRRRREAEAARQSQQASDRQAQDQSRSNERPPWSNYQQRQDRRSDSPRDRRDTVVYNFRNDPHPRSSRQQEYRREHRRYSERELDSGVTVSYPGYVTQGGGSECNRCLEIFTGNRCRNPNCRGTESFPRYRP
jgi:hypothetical protein